MHHHGQEAAQQLSASGAAQVACFLGSMALLLASLAAALVHFLAYDNLQFGHTSHLALFVAGWGIVLTCVWVAFRMVSPPAWHRLKLLGLAVPLLALFYWLYAQPLAKASLLH